MSALDAAAGPAAAGAAGEVRMARERWQYLKGHALASLRQAEAGCLVGGAQAHRFDVVAESFTGLSAHDIIKWHIKAELDKCAPSGPVATSAPVRACTAP
jgi:hypothetical protein